MHALSVSLSVVAIAFASVAGASEAINPDTIPVLVAQGTQQDLKAMERAGQRDDMTTMTAAQQAQYRAEYQAAKAK